MFTRLDYCYAYDKSTPQDVASTPQDVAYTPQDVALFPC